MILPEVDGIAISLHEGLTSESVSYEGGITDVRRSGGSLVRMQHWLKPVITLSGSGPLPLGLSAVTTEAPVVVKLTKMESASSKTASIALTSEPRQEFQPRGYALVDGVWLPTQCSVAGGIASLNVVPGSTQYRVSWMPQYSVMLDPIGGDMSESAMHSWSITGRVV